jgi:5-methylcytosine-specific restriction endonuclease McrA
MPKSGAEISGAFCSNGDLRVSHRHKIQTQTSGSSKITSASRTSKKPASSLFPPSVTLYISSLRRFIALGSFTPSEFKALCNQYGNVCLRCRKKRVLVADHVIPLARGGKNDITNIQPLCRTCNGMKGADSTDYRKRWCKR